MSVVWEAPQSAGLEDYELSERVWQDLTLALRAAERTDAVWEQNIVVRRWEPVDVQMVRPPRTPA